MFCPWLLLFKYSAARSNLSSFLGPYYCIAGYALLRVIHRIYSEKIILETLTDVYSVKIIWKP
jgi:hypothetical protein